VRRAGQRPRSGEAAIGGRRPVVEAIRSGRARRVVIARGADRTEGLQSLLDEADHAGISVEWVDPSTVESLVPHDHQGVVALASLPAELDQRTLASSSFDQDAVVVVLDGIMDPQNLGACARSAEAAGAAMLITRKRRAAPLSAAALRASAGALFHLPVARVPNIARAVETLQERGFHVIGLDHRGSSDIHTAPSPPRPVALVVGAEDVGLSRLVRETCDVLVAIPMAGRTSSLNASAALAVALFGYVLRAH
jgi:23S rRNA (guanosine2251-2'-O)-methyltransferase